MKSNSMNKSASAARTAMTLPGKMAPPTPGKAGTRKLAFLSFLCAIILGLLIYWLNRTPEEKMSLRSDAAQFVNEALANTPLSGMGKILTPEAKRPEPPVPPTDAGTLAGREIAGTILAPVDATPQSGAAGYAMPLSQNPSPEEPSTLQTLAALLGLQADPGQSPIAFSQEPVQPVTEDSTLKPGYVKRLAVWLVNRYHPAIESGHIAITPQSLNQECANTLESGVKGGRSALLRYAFNPSMLNGLYNLYVERFFADLEEAIHKKALNERQTRVFYRTLAGNAALLAQAVSGIEQLSNLKSRLRDMEQHAQKVVDANAALTSAVFEMDELREGNGSPEQLQRIQEKVTGAQNSYRMAERAYSQIQTDLARNIRQYAGPGLSDESLLFIAAWIERRRASGPQAGAAIHACVDILRNLAGRCTKLAEE